jgi:homotetrameric cytidine deaminase
MHTGLIGAKGEQLERTGNLREFLLMSSIDNSRLDELTQRALDAARNSYSHYSGFSVGAALRLSNGEIIAGTNVENASYGLTICAERSALVSAVSQFGPQIRVEAVVVVNLNSQPSPPCGACRQVLAEFILPDATVTFPASDGVKTMKFSELMPESFAFEKK